jgi:hypothetical protein
MIRRIGCCRSLRFSHFQSLGLLTLPLTLFPCKPLANNGVQVPPGRMSWVLPVQTGCSSGVVFSAGWIAAVASSSGAEASASVGTFSSMYNPYGVPGEPRRYGYRPNYIFYCSLAIVLHQTPRLPAAMNVLATGAISEMTAYWPIVLNSDE